MWVNSRLPLPTQQLPTRLCASAGRRTVLRMLTTHTPLLTSCCLSILQRGPATVHVSQYVWAAITKVLHAGQLSNNRHLFLKFLAAGSLTSGCWHGWVKLHFWVTDVSLCPHWWMGEAALWGLSPCVHGGRGADK